VFVRRLRGAGPILGCAERRQPLFSAVPKRDVKSAEEIMEILEAFDLTGSCRDATVLAGCSHHTVARYVRARA